MKDPELTAIRPGVGAVIYDERERLLLHRRHVGEGWAPISGHVEPGESLSDALHREVWEETGLTVSIERLISLNSDPSFQIITFPDGRLVHFVTALFECRVTGGALRGAGEGMDWAWFVPTDLPEPLLPYARIWLSDAVSQSSPGPRIR